MSSGKQEGPKLFSSRILSRDRSNVANASFRVYYSLGAGTVPFLWESKPGTPKSSVTPASAASSMPPISPPPSYQSRSQSKDNKCRGKSSSIWPAGGWISWLNQNIRRRSPQSSPTDHQQRWLSQDHGVGDHERRPWRPTLCF
ncbi:hypothetical protein SEVIR_2G091500v4 [Setaria viridis]|uniref:Uncharacterized protein n=1 Tax=Setaria viridis TaxID=4556 RepID=A0A4U6VTM8_SETVI|nr:uncharacterized protein LOC117842995 [Setaria viridis]TKW31229.1 hypothetical protein SEVIR_2G091500v2 [Setaria viridis]